MTNTWIVDAGTITGPGHRKTGEPNQDAHRVATYGPRQVIAVADGAGTHRYALDGATAAVEAAVTDFGSDPTTAVEDAFHAAQAAISGLDHPNQSGCTLAVFAADDTSWAAGVIGDSFAVLQTRDGKLHSVVAPRISEYANVTELLTSPGATPTIESGPIGDLTGFLLATDGFEHSALGPNQQPHPGLIGPLLDRLRRHELDLVAFFQFLEESGRLEDDTTLVLGVTAP